LLEAIDHIFLHESVTEVRVNGASSSAIATHAPQWLALKMVPTALATPRLTRTTLALRTTVPAIRVSPLHAEAPAALPLHVEVLVALHPEVWWFWRRT
jgi:hypothetical protein